MKDGNAAQKYRVLQCKIRDVKKRERKTHISEFLRHGQKACRIDPKTRPIRNFQIQTNNHKNNQYIKRQLHHITSSFTKCLTIK